jgi:amidase
MWKCRIEGAAEGVLKGRTVSFKDHIALAGAPMSFGSFALDGFIPDFDATVVTKVLQAGGTIIGKNVMNGLSGGFGTGGAIGDYGRPLNPHDREHVTGGSSSGSGAAVAAGEVDISFGGDQGGSIRIPAAFCGIIGHKPTFGLVSHFGIGFGSDQSIDYTGPMTRTVEDAAAALQATAGYDPYDPRATRDVPARMDVLGRLADGVAGLRIGVLQEGFDEAQHDVRDLVLAAVDVLAKEVPAWPRSPFPRTMPSEPPRLRSRARARWRSSRPASSAPSRGPTTPPLSSRPSTSCGPPRPTCSHHAPSYRSSPRN